MFLPFPDRFPDQLKIIDFSQESFMVNTRLHMLAPDFTMRDSESKEIRLSNYHGKKHIILVFNRGFQ